MSGMKKANLQIDADYRFAVAESNYSVAICVDCQKSEIKTLCRVCYDNAATIGLLYHELTEAQQPAVIRARRKLGHWIMQKGMRVGSNTVGETLLTIGFALVTGKRNNAK